MKFLIFIIVSTSFAIASADLGPESIVTPPAWGSDLPIFTWDPWLVIASKTFREMYRDVSETHRRREEVYQGLGKAY